MPTTAIHGLPYPTLTDPPNGPAQLQSLAVAVDAELEEGLANTTTAINTALAMTTITTGLVAGTGWSVAEFTASRVGKLVVARVAITRTGATITASGVGDITDVSMAALPGGWRPAFELSGVSVGDGFGCGEASINTSGQVVLRSWTPGASILASRVYACSPVFYTP